jgi:hypothetical protein
VRESGDEDRPLFHRLSNPLMPIRLIINRLPLQDIFIALTLSPLKPPPDLPVSSSSLVISPSTALLRAFWFWSATRFGLARDLIGYRPRRRRQAGAHHAPREASGVIISSMRWHPPRVEPAEPCRMDGEQNPARREQSTAPGGRCQRNQRALLAWGLACRSLTISC